MRNGNVSSNDAGSSGVSLGAVLIAAVVAVVVGAVLFYGLCWCTIDKGHVGVVSVFGELEQTTLDPGWHLVAPWKTVHRMSVQTTKNEEDATVPTKGGLPVKLKAVLLYRVKPSSAVTIAKEYGTEKYEEKVVDPYFKNAVRDACAEFTPEALYTNDRQTVETRVLEIARKELDARGFDCETVMLQEPVLPGVVQERITAKAGAEQDVQRMNFVLQKTKLEADARVAEAEGIAKAQKIIQQDLTPAYLTYLAIEALKTHTGSMVYMIPTNANGLPVVGNLELPRK